MVVAGYGAGPRGNMAVATFAKNTVLVVDDNYTNRLHLRALLAHYDFDLIEATSGEEALGIFSTAKCDAVLLDMKLPRLGGIEICRILRRNSPFIPIIMLTALVSEDLIVEAFEEGADDYITRPFSPRELIARISAAIRRNMDSHRESAEMSIGDITIDPAYHLVLKRGKPIHLTPKQFDLLRYLMTHAGRPVPHESLLHTVWGPGFAKKYEYLRTVVRALRIKIEDDPSNPRYLVTDSRFGYRFTEPSLFEKTA